MLVDENQGVWMIVCWETVKKILCNFQKHIKKMWVICIKDFIALGSQKKQTKPKTNTVKRLLTISPHRKKYFNPWDQSIDLLLYFSNCSHFTF